MWQELIVDIAPNRLEQQLEQGLYEFQIASPARVFLSEQSLARAKLCVQACKKFSCAAPIPLRRRDHRYLVSPADRACSKYMKQRHVCLLDIGDVIALKEPARHL